MMRERLDRFVHARLTDGARFSRDQMVKELLERGRVGPAVGVASEVLVKRNLYVDLVRALSLNGRVVRNIRGFEMYLDPTDDGIAYDLLIRGTREIASSTEFQRRISDLSAEADGKVVVLDVGANIGYYVLLECQAAGPQADVYAVEPNPESVSLLEANVTQNEYDDRVTISPCAIADEDGSATLLQSSYSNHSRIATTCREFNDDVVDTYQVEGVTMETLLDRHALDPGSVNVVRADIEGYDDTIVSQLEPILLASGPLVVFLELHLVDLSDSQLRRIIRTFERANLELVQVAKNDEVLDIDSLNELADVSWWAEVMLQRGSVETN